MDRDPLRRRLQPGHAALLLPLVTALLLGWHSLADRDVWFHARAGQDLLAEGRLVQVNRYSFTAPDHPWLNHEWLFQAAVAATAPAVPTPADDPVLGWNLLRAGLVLTLMLVLLLGDGVWRPTAPDSVAEQQHEHQGQHQA
ncbi:MAG: hypothetical protein IH621_01850, partial [Krumholzibacteria bacterium]|nr:hypothetical protein [Candidatus Krumholzibacteria bacterium]